MGLKFPFQITTFCSILCQIFKRRKYFMKSYRLLFGFMALLVIVSLACGGSSAPATNPTLPPVPTNPPVEQPTEVQNQASSDALVTFTDENGLLEFDLPGDWFYEHEDMGRDIYTDATAYRDTFASPDETAFIESLVIFADNEVNNSVSQGVALDILNTYYSSTGQNNGDIRISGEIG